VCGDGRGVRWGGVIALSSKIAYTALSCVAACCSVLHSVAELQSDAESCRMLLSVAQCCTVLQ